MRPCEHTDFNGMLIKEANKITLIKHNKYALALKDKLKDQQQYFIPKSQDKYLLNSESLLTNNNNDKTNSNSTFQMQQTKSTFGEKTKSSCNNKNFTHQSGGQKKTLMIRKEDPETLKQKQIEANFRKHEGNIDYLLNNPSATAVQIKAFEKNNLLDGVKAEKGIRGYPAVKFDKFMQQLANRAALNVSNLKE